MSDGDEIFWRTNGVMIMMVIGVVVIIVAIASCVQSTSKRTDAPVTVTLHESSSAEGPGVGPTVTGSIRDSEFVLGDREILRGVRRNTTWCRWNDGQVEMHVHFRNATDARVTVELQPNYRLLNAGDHGGDVESRENISIEAGTSLEWVQRLGHPAGVNGMPEITGCLPVVNSIKAG